MGDDKPLCTEQENGQPCGREVFTIKSGLCARHYDRARTARKAAERPTVVMVRDKKCFLCGGIGYKSWDDPPGSAICHKHYDRWRRHGVLDDLPEPLPQAPKICEVDGCLNVAPYLQYGVFCQNHHRMAKRRGSADLTIEVPKGPPRTGITDHRKKPEGQIAAELAASRSARIGKDCGKGLGHLLGGENLRVNADGSLTCRACEREHQQRYLASEKARAAAEARYEQDQLKKKERALMHNYGITLTAYDAMVSKYDGNCHSCRKPLLLGTKAVCVDHDHACCAGPQSCGQCVRGLICNTCNSAFGFFRDDPVAMAYGLAYLLTTSVSVDSALFGRCADIVQYED